MPDQSGSENPSDDPKKPDAMTPTIEQRLVALERDVRTHTETDETSKLTDEIHWVHKATLISQVGLGLIGIVALFIYYGQLEQMRTATEANTKAVKLAQDSFEISDGDFQRTMHQTIHQTVSQAESAKAATDAAQAMTNQVSKLQAGVDQSSRLADEAGKANTNAARALEAQTRPWIGVIGEPENIKQGDILKGVDPQTHGIDFTIKLKNFGQFPATRVTPHAIALYKNTVDVRESVCREANKAIGDKPHFPKFTAIFPGDVESTPISGVNMEERSNPHLLICVAYKGRDASLSPYNTWIVYTYTKRTLADGKVSFENFQLEDSDAQ